MLKYRELASTFTKVEIHNGALTSFWYDDWSPLGKLIHHTGLRGCIDLGINIHSSVEKVFATHRRRRHRVEILNRIEDAIQTQRQKGTSQQADVFVWRQKGDKFKPKFSSKLTGNQIRAPQPLCEWYKGIWFTYATPKYSFIAWLAIHNRLSTGDRVLNWNIGATGCCIFCQDMESRNHLFFRCKLSEEIWAGLTRMFLGDRYTSQWDMLIDLLVDTSQDMIRLFLIRYVFQAAIHSLWRERNRRRHGEPPTPQGTLMHHIDKQVRNRLSSIRKFGDTRYEEGMQIWLASR